MKILKNREYNELMSRIEAKDNDKEIAIDSLRESNQQLRFLLEDIIFELQVILDDKKMGKDKVIKHIYDAINIVKKGMKKAKM